MENTVKSFFDDLIAKVQAVSDGYAAKHGIARDADWFMLKLQEEVGELTQAFLKVTGRARLGNESAMDLKQNVADEAADVMCHLLLFAGQNDIDLSAAMQKKWFGWLAM